MKTIKHRGYLLKMEPAGDERDFVVVTDWDGSEVDEFYVDGHTSRERKNEAKDWVDRWMESQFEDDSHALDDMFEDVTRAMLDEGL